MFKGNFQFRVPDPLMLLALVVCASTLISTKATAAESFFSKPDLDDLMDGEVMVARMGQHGPAVHMSFISSADAHRGEAVTASAARHNTARPEVYLSIRLPW